MSWIEVIGQCFVDMRADWYAGEQQILAIRDALWPVVLKHELLGASVASIAEVQAEEGRGLCYEQVAGVEYRCFEWRWLVRQQWQSRAEASPDGSLALQKAREKSQKQSRTHKYVVT